MELTDHHMSPSHSSLPDRPHLHTAPTSFRPGRPVGAFALSAGHPSTHSPPDPASPGHRRNRRRYKVRSVALDAYWSRRRRLRKSRRVSDTGNDEHGGDARAPERGNDLHGDTLPSKCEPIRIDRLVSLKDSVARDLRIDVCQPPSMLKFQRFSALFLRPRVRADEVPPYALARLRRFRSVALATPESSIVECSSPAIQS